MNGNSQLHRLLSGMIGEILQKYDERVPERGAFGDLRVGAQFHFDDPDTTLPGRVELVVMHMDSRLDPKYDVLRFVSVRVMKSRQGGYASSTCLHGSKSDLRQQLEEQRNTPFLLATRVEQLAHGLPEETNPDIWR